MSNEKEQKIAIFYFDGLTEAALHEIRQILCRELKEYGIKPILFNHQIHTLGRAEILDILKTGFKELNPS